MSLLNHNVNAPSLHVLLLHELKDLYDAEHRILEALPMMAQKATDPDLRRALEEHTKETELQITRLEDCFEFINEKPHRETCDGTKGLITEAQHMTGGKMDPAVMDDAIIAAVQRVEHYEIASYGSAREHAKYLGLDDVAERLDATLQEEGKADQTLTKVAKNMHKELAHA